MKLTLAGKRIVVTRAAHQAGRLADALGHKGAEVIPLATIAIVPPKSFAGLDQAIQDVHSFDWLILTSANGVSSLADRVNIQLGSWDRFRHLQIATIGPGTAEAVRRLGLAVHLTPGEYVAETIVESLKDHVAGKNLLLVRGAMGRDLIPQALSRAGAKVTVAEAYQTILPENSIHQIKDLFVRGSPLPDAVTFTSSSTVDNFFVLLNSAGLDLPPELRAVSIGPITSRTLCRHHWEPAAQAAASDIPRLVEACERLLKAP